MLESNITRSKAKKWLGISLAPVFVIISLIYQNVVQKFIEDSNVTDTLATRLGFLVTSYWGIAFIILAIAMMGSLLTLWVEDFLENGKKHQTTANIEFSYDEETKTYSTSKMENIKHWRYVGDENFPKVFVMFQSPLEKSIISVSAGVKNGNWSEQYSSESFAFVNIIRLEGSGWFDIHFIESSSVPDQRRQCRNEEMNVSYISPEDKGLIATVENGLLKWDKMNKVQKLIHRHVKKLKIYDHP